MVALSAVVLCVYNDVVLGLTWVAAKEKFIFEPQAKMSRKKLAAQQLNCNTVSKTQPFSFFFSPPAVCHLDSQGNCLAFPFCGLLHCIWQFCGVIKGELFLVLYILLLPVTKQKKKQTLRCITALWLLSLSVRLGPFVAGYQVLAAQFRLW